MALTYDRDVMAQLGISVSDANNLLNNAFRSAADLPPFMSR